MLNSINQKIYKKCLFPLFTSLLGSVWLYGWNIGDSYGYYEMFISIVTMIVFIYALRNIWMIADNSVRIKLYRYIIVFAIVLNVSIYAVSIVFQGFIAFIVAVCMLVGFWKIITI